MRLSASKGSIEALLRVHPKTKLCFVSAILVHMPPAVACSATEHAAAATEHATDATEPATHTAAYLARPHTAVCMA